MKKLFTFWRRKEDTLSSQHSDLVPSKEFKKLARAVSVGDFVKVMKYVKFKKYDVNMRDSEFRWQLKKSMVGRKGSWRPPCPLNLRFSFQCPRDNWPGNQLLGFHLVQNVSLDYLLSLPLLFGLLLHLHLHLHLHSTQSFLHLALVALFSVSVVDIFSFLVRFTVYMTRKI